MSRSIVETEAGSGLWNMAVDEALLEAAVAGGEPAFRWYQWSEPTLSLGYFQDVAEVARTLIAPGLPIVRRLSGGGAILHHHELTYSLTIPSGHALAHDPHQLYLSVHERIISVLEGFGYPVRLRGEKSAEGDLPPPFLCFGRGDEFDVVLQGHKVLGSAQRRRRGSILQHGSLMYRHSEFATEYPGLFDLADSAVEIHLLRQELATRVGLLLGGDAEFTALKAGVMQRARELAARLASDSVRLR